MSVENLWGLTGSGKSYVTTYLVMEHLYTGGVVGMNYRLKDEWAYFAALEHPLFRNGKVDFETCVKSLQKRCFYIGNSDTVNELAKMAHDLCVGAIKDKKEHKTRVFIDEAQLYLNTRNFRDNFSWMTCCSQHRKNGLDMTFICHHPSQLDKQVMHYVSYITQVYNLHEQLKLWGTEIRFPWSVIFLRTRAKGERKVSLRWIGRPKPKIYELYDSYEIFAFDELSSVVEPQGRLFPDTCKLYEKAIVETQPEFEWPERGLRYDWLDFLTGQPDPAMAC